jgi:hypothetical protein
MKLKFLARDGHTVRWPGLPSTGQIHRAVGRSFVPGNPAKREPSRLSADESPTEIDSDSPQAPHLIRQCQKGGLWAADADTAAFCGVEFVELARDTDGEWIAAQKKQSATSRAARAAEPERKAEV